MALHVSDAGPQGAKKIKFKLSNSTEIEIVFVIGKKSFTLQPGQTKLVRAQSEISIEARPQLIGIESGFLVGGVKNDCTILCFLESNGNGSQSLALDRSY